MTEPTAQDRVKLAVQLRLQAAREEQVRLIKEVEELEIAERMWKAIDATSYLRETRLRLHDAGEEIHHRLAEEISLMERALAYLDARD